MLYTPTLVALHIDKRCRRPPPDTEYSADLWAPELHAVSGRWYIYFAAGHPAAGNKSHRMYVLGGPPASSDPITGGQWDFLGPVRGMPPTQWAIDGTIAPLNNSLYFVYSGWPLENGDRDDDRQQQLFIMALASPTEGASAPVMISRPEHAWECSDGKGINEGPQFLAAPDGRWLGLVYSCAGSWTRDYKMNTLQFLGGDPLDPRAWRKADRPLIAAGSRGPFGPGHGSFLDLGGEVVGVFHATDRETDGWENRKARVQRVIFTEQGPEMGGVVGPLTNSPQVFMGQAPLPQQQQQPLQAGTGGSGEGGRQHGKLHGFLHSATEKLQKHLG